MNKKVIDGIKLGMFLIMIAFFVFFINDAVRNKFNYERCADRFSENFCEEKGLDYLGVVYNEREFRCLSENNIVVLYGIGEKDCSMRGEKEKRR